MEWDNARFIDAELRFDSYNSWETRFWIRIVHHNASWEFFNVLLSLWFHHMYIVHANLIAWNIFEYWCWYFLLALILFWKETDTHRMSYNGYSLFMQSVLPSPPIETLTRATGVPLSNLTRLHALQNTWWRAPLLIRKICHFFSNSSKNLFQVQRHRSVLSSFYSPPEVTQTWIKFCICRWRNQVANKSSLSAAYSSSSNVNSSTNGSNISRAIFTFYEVFVLLD